MFALGIEGRDDGQPLRPGNESFHAREKPLPARDFLFGGKFGASETRLMRRA